MFKAPTVRNETYYVNLDRLPVSSHFKKFKVQQKESSSQLVESERWEVKVVAVLEEFAPGILFVNILLFTFISQRQKARISYLCVYLDSLYPFHQILKQPITLLKIFN